MSKLTRAVPLAPFSLYLLSLALDRIQEHPRHTVTSSRDLWRRQRARRHMSARWTVARLFKGHPEHYLVSNCPLSLPWTPQTAPFFLPCPPSTSKAKAEPPSVA